MTSGGDYRDDGAENDSNKFAKFRNFKKKSFKSKLQQESGEQFTASSLKQDYNSDYVEQNKRQDYSDDFHYEDFNNLKSRSKKVE